MSDTTQARGMWILILKCHLRSELTNLCQGQREGILVRCPAVIGVNSSHPLTEMNSRQHSRTAKS
jgi:hypothetical protein